MSTPKDALSLSECSDLYGELLIIDNGYPGIVSIPNLSTIGNILVENVTNLPGNKSTLTGISLPDLTSATNIDIVGASALTTIDLPALGGASEINLYYLPRLQTWTGFKSNVLTGAISIVHTGLSSLRWDSKNSTNARISEGSYSSGSLDINNNTFLDEISLINVAQIDGPLRIIGNGQTKITLGLTTGSYIGISGCSQILPVTATDNITELDELELHDNLFTNISFAGVKSMEGSINIHNNPNLEHVSFPNLVSIGGAISNSYSGINPVGELRFSNNTVLKRIAGPDLGNLTSVHSIANFTGNFEQYITPSLSALK